MSVMSQKIWLFSISNVIVHSWSHILCTTSLFLKVAVGSSHVAMVTMEHVVYTWGSNCCGQLGHGDSNRHDKPTQVEALKSKTILR